MAERREQMSRAVRTARGVSGALISTLLAAASHTLAGGTITPIAVIATAVLVLPLCVALAGRMGSLWRLSLGVVLSQFLYHWTFSGLGLATATQSSQTEAAEVLGPHAAHLSALSFAPDLIESGAADLWMWGAHGAAAAVSVALMHRGELAALRLLQLVRAALVRCLPLPAKIGAYERPSIRPSQTTDALREQLTMLSAISHRGPPRVAMHLIGR